MGQKIHKERDQELSHGVNTHLNQKSLGAIQSLLDRIAFGDENEKVIP